jgi:hypothetical protein
MKRTLVVALALMAGMLSSPPLPARAAAGSLLFYGPSILGSPDTEVTLAQAAGYDVTVADASTWVGMTTFEFQQYDAIVFGDPSCTYETPAPLAAAEFNKFTWSAAVSGPKVVIGTDPMYHQSEFGRQAVQLTQNAMAFAASGPGTGLYASLSCYYAGTASSVDFLNAFGSFQVVGQGAGGLDPCPNDVGILQPEHPVMNGITVAGLSNWSCSIHEAFTAYPTEFQAVARDNPTQFPYVIATPGGGVITDAPQRYAPYVWLHSKESADPDSAPRFIANSRLRWSHWNCRDHAVENPDGSDASYDAIDQARLGEGAGGGAYSHPGNLVQGSVCIHGSRDYLANEFTRPRQDSPDRVTQGAEGMFLDLKNGEHHGNPTLADDPVYYDYVPQHYVVYWFFYSYNNFSFHSFPEKHEGDWEHVTVQLDEHNRPLRVAFYRHACDPTIVEWADLANGSQGSLVDGTHPVVYSGLGSHASYPTPGENGGFATCQPFPDQTDAGTPWSTWLNVQDVHAQPWYGFGGAWGEVGNDLHIPGIPPDLTTGPLGPSRYKGSGAPAGW